MGAWGNHSHQNDCAADTHSYIKEIFIQKTGIKEEEKIDTKEFVRFITDNIDLVREKGVHKDKDCILPGLCMMIVSKVPNDSFQDRLSRIFSEHEHDSPMPQLPKWFPKELAKEVALDLKSMLDRDEPNSSGWRDPEGRESALKSEYSLFSGKEYKKSNKD